MAAKERKYSFVLSPLFLALYAIALALSSIVLSAESTVTSYHGWIPILTGIAETKFLATSTSVFITLAITGVTAAIVYITNSREINTGRDSVTLLFFYLIILFSTPDTVIFSGTTAAAPLVLLSLSSTIKSVKGEKEIFAAGFLMALATLFDFHLVYLIPFFFYYALVNNSFSLRGLSIFISALILPYLFIISLRYILFDDAMLFIEHLFNDLSAISSPSIKVESVPALLLIIYALYISYRVVSSLLGRLSSFKTIKSIAVVRFITTILIFTVISLFYSNIPANYITLGAIPGAFLLNEHLCTGEERKKRVEFIILLVLISLARIAEFM